MLKQEVDIPVLTIYRNINNVYMYFISSCHTCTILYKLIFYVIKE